MQLYNVRITWKKKNNSKKHYIISQTPNDRVDSAFILQQYMLLNLLISLTKVALFNWNTCKAPVPLKA